MNAKWEWDTWHDERFAIDDCIISMSPSPPVARSAQEAATHSMLLTAQSSCVLEWATVGRLWHNRFARNGSLTDNILAYVKTFAILHIQLLHVQCHSWYASATQQTHFAREFSWTRSSLSPRNTRLEHKAVTRAGTRKDYPPMQAFVFRGILFTGIRKWFMVNCAKSSMQYLVRKSSVFKKRHFSCWEASI